MQWLEFITDFGDQAVLLPLAVAVALLLAHEGWSRGLRAWLRAVGGVFAVMAALKIGLVAAADHGLVDHVISPSGHTAAACVVYGGLAILLLPGRLPILLAVVTAVVVGVTRVELMMHTPGEVVAGAIVGGMGLVALQALAGPRAPLRPWPFALAAATLMLALHGLRMPAEAAIYEAARLL